LKIHEGIKKVELIIGLCIFFLIFSHLLVPIISPSPSPYDLKFKFVDDDDDGVWKLKGGVETLQHFIITFRINISHYYYNDDGSSS